MSESRPRVVWDMYGMPRVETDTAGMLDPRRCGLCGHVHDTAHAKVVARYLDCSVWLCPKCGGQQDDRDFLTGLMHAAKVVRR